VRWVRLSSGELLTRVRAEKARPQASVWFGGSSAEFMSAAGEGLLASHRPASYLDFRSGTFDPTWRWVGISESLVGFASNPRVLKEQGAGVPRAWRDLLRPEYRDLVSMAYAYTSGTAYTIAAALVQLFGTGGAFDYWKALDRNVHHYNRSGSACVTQVGLGEVGTCIAFTNDILTKGISRGYDMVMTFPEEGAAFEVDGIALIQGAPEEALGRAFIDFMLGEPAQKLLGKMHRIPMRTDVGPGLDLPASGTVKRIAFDAAAAARERVNTIERWREATGQ
jgi:iron(III) transport system substrate-binding protein